MAYEKANRTNVKENIELLLKMLEEAEFNQYEIIKETGPDHDKTFTAEVKLNGKVLATGEGKTKKQAEMNAADKALKNL